MSTNFICPVNGANISSPYGNRLHPVYKVYQLHSGVDLTCKSVGKPSIFAAYDGVVSSVITKKDGYGKHIIITHSIKGEKYETLYAHLDSFSISQGSTVKQGQKIGVMGTTGTSTGIHLHFEIHQGSYNYGSGMYPNSRDPMKYITLNYNQSNMKEEGELTMSQYKELLIKIEELEKKLAAKSDRVSTNAVSPTHKEFYDWAVANGLTDGSNPSGTLQRQQLFTVLNRYHKKFILKK